MLFLLMFFNSSILLSLTHESVVGVEHQYPFLTERCVFLNEPPCYFVHYQEQKSIYFSHSFTLIYIHRESFKRVAGVAFVHWNILRLCLEWLADCQTPFSFSWYTI